MDVRGISGPKTYSLGCFFVPDIKANRFPNRSSNRTRRRHKAAPEYCWLSPKGPKIEKFQDRPPGLKFSIEIENFKRATQQTPVFFVGNSGAPGLKFSILKIEIFDRD